MKVASLYLIGRRKGIIVPDKPHIWLERGYWRVSPKLKPYTTAKHYGFRKAHEFINTLNAKLNKR